MSQSETSVGATGLIRVAGLEVTITPLSQAEEMAFDRELRRAATAAAGDHYARCKPALEARRDSPADRVEFLREIARMTARKEGLAPAALWDYQNSAPGLALELYHRGKRATPGLTLKGLQAIVTEQNADEVAAALRELLRGESGNS